MKQEIYGDPYKFEDWDLENTSRCFVHIASSITWRAITDEMPPAAEQSNKHALPWFDYYDADMKALNGAGPLQNLKMLSR